jgi:hypothetical protein
MCNPLEGARGQRRSDTFLLNFALFSLSLLLAAVLTACGAASHIASSAPNPNPSVEISLSPNAATLTPAEQVQFTAHIRGTSYTEVAWSATAGTISSRGLFTAPKVSSAKNVIVTATIAGKVGPRRGPEVVNLDSLSSGSATVQVTPAASLAITNSPLPAANVNVHYSASLSYSGGTAPYQWTLASGNLPPGIKLQSSTGTITGTTTQAGSYPLSVQLTDASEHKAHANLILKVLPNATSLSGNSGVDASAELPRIYIQSAMSNTPARGSIITVNAGGDLQAALNSATCGDTIQLQAGATFAGVFTFPAKNCDDNHWIVVRTSAPDSVLPPEGSRLTPCYAGISSLVGRPALQCGATKNVLAKLVVNSSSNGPVVFASDANHYRLIGLEITRPSGTGVVRALVWVPAVAHNVVLDRVWVHGTAQDETTRGLSLGQSTYVSVLDSSFTDFHCISVTGSCGDAQAILGGLGGGPMGPYKIVNNFLEASGENILFGGGAATATPADIEIRHNHFFKPLTWMQGQPGFVGGANGNPFGVKNLFELKNAQRVLLEGNILENCWGGVGQVGYAILLTPVNQGNLCPICQVTDVTIRYNAVHHVAAGLQIVNALPGTGPALDGQRYSIHDIVIDDIDGVKYRGPGTFALISVTPGAPVIQNLTINHVTAFPSKSLLLVGDTVSVSTPMKNFTFTNNIVNAGIYPVWSASGSAADCAVSNSPLTVLNSCFSNYTFANNAVIAPPAAASAAKWPPRNFFPAGPSSVPFANYNGGKGGDYHLHPSSSYRTKGSDRKDLGADIDAIKSAISAAD